MQREHDNRISLLSIAEIEANFRALKTSNALDGHANLLNRNWQPAQSPNFASNKEDAVVYSLDDDMDWIFNEDAEITKSIQSVSNPLGSFSLAPPPKNAPSPLPSNQCSPAPCSDSAFLDEFSETERNLQHPHKGPINCFIPNRPFQKFSHPAIKK
ncbi:hypothetical protein DI09_133p80 [Mitosporidium daphniae]|uniref:Uncharacterized protein n=1 Tax=Mitosporidium daphniae TaxID=1485682 RepID=A0A098VV35_9MICR|nr:uncharacterized protein DI09_133p80 [Mitosporidium daphniae]KGG52807.1 hypothetical protein DI09_133p80 [Mitosporidium daphniae]|eukprot:XP_013239243.1 uncharacterized protein DI09_133p80 [Mitosporidium daphniae]